MTLSQNARILRNNEWKLNSPSVVWVCGWPVMVYDVSLSPSPFHWFVWCGCHNSFIAAQTRLVIVCDYCNCSTIILSLDCYCAVCTIHSVPYLSSIVGSVSRWCRSVGAFVLSFSSINECLRNEQASGRRKTLHTLSNEHMVRERYERSTLRMPFNETKNEIWNCFFFLFSSSIYCASFVPFHCSARIKWFVQSQLNWIHTMLCPFRHIIEWAKFEFIKLP